MGLLGRSVRHVVKYLVMSKVTLNWGWHVIIYTTKNKMEKNILVTFFFVRIYLLASRTLLWDILRLPSSRRAALGLYVILTLYKEHGA